jgi:nanoRNase/pAp phosphatase (c-di-AMP/oligoRNAs hydrolase)
MPTSARDDARGTTAPKAPSGPSSAPPGSVGSTGGAAGEKANGNTGKRQSGMTAFVESCVETVAGSAVAVARGTRHRPKAGKLLRLLRGKTNILVATHQYPDPDALASSYALKKLLEICLPEAEVTFAVKGPIGGGYNAAFAQLSDLKPAEWDDEALGEFDAIILLDVQPGFKFSPLPPGVSPTAVIDHHRARGRRARCPFCDIRTDVGATSSIIFSYFMELEIDITPDLAATLLFAIETDLAGAAGTPGELDNMALSSLTLLADTRKLYKMRYVELPKSVYVAFAESLNNATVYDSVAFTHLQSIESPETPAVIADFLLRYDQVQWVLVTALVGVGTESPSLALSLRTQSTKISAADAMRRLVRGIGEGGGHRTKAGGSVALTTSTPTEIERVRATLRRRILRSLHIPTTRGQRLVPQKG